MTTFQLRTQLDDLLGLVSPQRILMKYMQVLARGFEHISEVLSDQLHLTNRTLFSKKHIAARDATHELRKQTEAFPMGQIFHEAIELRSTLGAMRPVLSADAAGIVDQMQQHADAFYKAFERFARTGDDEAFVLLLHEARRAFGIFLTARQSFEAVRASLGDGRDAPVPPGRGRLSLWFEATASFDGVALKMPALDRAYGELCALTSTSSDAYPLELSKMESAGPQSSGLWLSVTGEAAVVSMLASLFGGYAQFLYRRFTAGDRIATASERVLSTQSLINLTDELERAGLSQVVHDDARMKDAALSLRREFVTLLLGEPAVHVNGRVYEVVEGERGRFIAESADLMPEPRRVVSLTRQAG